MRVYISRIVAGPVAALVAFLVGLGLELGAGFETALTEVITLFAIAVLTSAYGVVHKLIDKRLNPGDVASTKRFDVAPIIALLLFLPLMACGGDSGDRGDNRADSVVVDTASGGTGGPQEVDIE